MDEIPVHKDDLGNEYLFLRGVTTDILRSLYSVGFFPMADARDDPDYYWIRPIERAVFTFDSFHLSRSLTKFIKTMDWQVTINRDFNAVINACATTRPDTWINDDIETLYQKLHQQGHAHSIEVYCPGKILIGGIYGLAQNGVFCGESMFSKMSNASNVALVALMTHLRQCGFSLCDTQFVNDHLVPFGCHLITRESYQAQLSAALESSETVSFSSDNDSISVDSLLEFAAFCKQSNTQTS